MQICITESMAPFLPLLKEKSVIEIGSRYINGSIRPFAELFAKNYIGVDIIRGKFVDELCPAEMLVQRFGKESFDVVICLETLEHIKNWKLAVENIKAIVKKSGYVFISSPAIGFPYHEYPHDFWRFELEDFRRIFKDFKILYLSKENDTSIIIAKKPVNYIYMPFNFEVHYITKPNLIITFFKNLIKTIYCGKLGKLV